MKFVYGYDAFLTRIIPGEKNFQHHRKYRFGRCPTMLSMFLQNFSVPVKNENQWERTFWPFSGGIRYSSPHWLSYFCKTTYKSNSSFWKNYKLTLAYFKCKHSVYRHDQLEWVLPYTHPIAIVSISAIRTNEIPPLWMSNISNTYSPPCKK